SSRSRSSYPAPTPIRTARSGTAGRHVADSGDSATVRGLGFRVRGPFGSVICRVRIGGGKEKRRRLEDYGKRPLPRGFRRLFPPRLYPWPTRAKHLPSVGNSADTGGSPRDRLRHTVHGPFEQLVRHGQRGP